FQAIEDAVCRTADASAVVDSRWLTLRSQAFGALCAVLPEESAAVKLVTQYAISASNDSAVEQAVKLAFLSSAISERPEIFTTAGGDILASVVASVERGMESSGDIDQGLAAIQAIQVAKNALLCDTLTPNGESPAARSLVAALIRTVDPQTMGSFDTDTQHAAMLALKTLAKRRFDIIRPVRDTIVLVAIAHVRDRVITVKLAAERCLLYALRLAKLSEEETGDVAGLEEFVRDVGEEKGRAVVDYHRRVLAKLADSTRELDYVSDVEAIDNTEDTSPTTEVVNVNTGLINANTYLSTTDFTGDGNNVSLENAADNINVVPPLWGLTYSPYNTDGTCSDFNTVADQLLKIATVTSNIRLYSTDCSQLSNVLEAVAKNNIALGVHVGIWVTDGVSRMESDLDQFVVAAKHYDSSLIKGVSVGNEEIFKGMSESTLIEYINQVRARLQAEGMSHIPVYTTETDAHFSKAL
ncbi:hypothetical protein GGF37_004884, partial [Kickxella alabastrina]